MKKSTLLVFIILLLCPTLALAASIKGSKHDFSFPGNIETPFSGIFETANGPVDEICVFCHTPHSANSDSGRELNTLLWNRSYPTSITYDVYTSPTLDVQPDNPPKGITLMCMSCHDGITSIAVGTLLNAPGSGNPGITVPSGSADKIGDIYDGGFLGWGANIGEGVPGSTSNINLGNDHPTSFTWVEGVTGRTDAQIGFSDTTVKLFTIGGRTKMECATCHNVHDPATPPFLRMSNDGSAMCLRCHNK